MTSMAIGATAIAVAGFLAGMAAVAELGSLRAPGPTVARIKPFALPLAQAASCSARPPAMRRDSEAIDEQP